MPLVLKRPLSYLSSALFTSFISTHCSGTAAKGIGVSAEHQGHVAMMQGSSMPPILLPFWKERGLVV